MSAGKKKVGWPEFFDIAGTKDPVEISGKVGVSATSVERTIRRQEHAPMGWVVAVSGGKMPGRDDRTGAFRITTTVEGPPVDWNEIMLELGMKDRELAREFMAFYERMTDKAISAKGRASPPIVEPAMSGEAARAVKEK